MLVRNMNRNDGSVAPSDVNYSRPSKGTSGDSLIDFDDPASHRLYPKDGLGTGTILTPQTNSSSSRVRSDSSSSLLNNNRNPPPNDNSDILSDFDTVTKVVGRAGPGPSNLNLLSQTFDPPGPAPMSKMSDAYLSGVKSESLKTHQNHNNLRQGQVSAPNTPELMRKQHFLTRYRTEVNNMTSSHPPLATAKKEKMEFNNQMMMRMNHNELREGRPLSYHGRSNGDSNPSLSSPGPALSQGSPVNKRHVGSSVQGRSRNKESALMNRRSLPAGAYPENRFRDKFDISDLDTNLPRIDIEAIENHLRLAREEERKRRTDRDEIRRRLALESEDLNNDKPGRKPSLHSRLQSTSDSESPGSDTEAKQSQPPTSLPFVKAPAGVSAGSEGCNGKGSIIGASTGNASSGTQAADDFYSRQARLQADARHALSQAKDMARLQMSNEKERRVQSPITEMVRNSLLKVGVSLPPERRRVSRQLLTEMNVAQLQVIVNDLHTHIEVLNETLVSMLLDRDDLHMEQDSMLVDIEDLTRYLAAKDNSPHQSLPLIASSKLLLGKK